MNHEHLDNMKELAKFIAIWLGTFMANINNWVLFATLIYTIIQIYILIRDKVLTKRKGDYRDVG